MKPREREYCKIIGNALRNLRKTELKKSLNRFANENDISSSTLSHIELGQHQAGIVNIKKIADSMGLSLTELVSILEKNLPDNFRIFEDDHY